MVKGLMLVALGVGHLLAADSSEPKPRVPAVPAAVPPPVAPTVPTPQAIPPAQSTPVVQPTPSGDAPVLDAVTAKRAAQAADAYLQSTNPVHADATAEKTLAEAEILLLEAQGFLEVKDPLKAGESYLEAVKKLSAIPDEQRPALGNRLRKASLTLTALSRRLLADKAYDVGTPEPAPAH